MGAQGRAAETDPEGRALVPPPPPPARYPAGLGSADPLRELGRHGSVGEPHRAGARAQPGGAGREGGRSRDEGAPTPRGAALQGPRRGDGGGRVGVGPERLLGSARAGGDVRQPGLREGCAGTGRVVVGVRPRRRGPEESP